MKDAKNDAGRDDSQDSIRSTWLVQYCQQWAHQYQSTLVMPKTCVGVLAKSSNFLRPGAAEQLRARQHHFSSDPWHPVAVPSSAAPLQLRQLQQLLSESHVHEHGPLQRYPRAFNIYLRQRRTTGNTSQTRDVRRHGQTLPQSTACLLHAADGQSADTRSLLLGVARLLPMATLTARWNADV